MEEKNSSKIDMETDIDLKTEEKDEENKSTKQSDSKTNLFPTSFPLLDCSPVSDDSILVDENDNNDVVNQKQDENNNENIIEDNNNNNNNENNDNDDNNHKDEDRSEAVYRHKFTNIFDLKQSRVQKFSPVFYVRNLPWRIMLLLNYETDFIGVFLQCNPESELCWSCLAYFEIRYISFKNNEENELKSLKKSQHLFTNQENDWGYAKLFNLTESKTTNNSHVKDNSITIEVYLIADAPHGILWNSKKYTGYIGLKNQGATCYMNSILQTLFFTNLFRKIVYKMPTECDDSNRSVALALQKVFYDLQFSNIPVGTNRLTKSFGWDAVDSFMQHDIQEFLRVLMDKLEIKMKNTDLDGAIPKLFEGKMISYIRCKNIDITSQRIETYYDIQLNIKGNKNIYESFENYIATETLDGDNKYDAGEHGLQDAEKGVLFISFPPVLHLHLMRFQYDPVTDNSIKFNDHYQFYEEINLKPYLADNFSKNIDKTKNDMDTDDDDNETKKNNKNDDNDDAANYLLHAVLVHAGDNSGGHYVVYINPKLDGNWCKFDDDVVSKCTKYDAIHRNFGGPQCYLKQEKQKQKQKQLQQQQQQQQENATENTEEQEVFILDDDDLISNDKQMNSNAYMLVYIRKTEISNILQNVDKDDIPIELIERFNYDENLEKINNNDCLNETLSSIKYINIVLDEDFEIHHGIGLFNIHKIQYRKFRFMKNQTINDIRTIISDTFKISIKNFRLWLLNICNQIIQFNYIDLEQQKDQKISDLCLPMIAFLTFSSTHETNEPIIMFLERKQYDDIDLINIDNDDEDDDDDDDDYDNYYYNYENNMMMKMVMKNDLKKSKDNDNNMLFDKTNDCLIFIKYYNGIQKNLNFICYKKLKMTTKIYELFKFINMKLFKKMNTRYTVYMERGFNAIKKLDEYDCFETIWKIFAIKGNGIILLFEEEYQDNDNIDEDNNDEKILNDSNNFMNNPTGTTIMNDDSGEGGSGGSGGCSLNVKNCESYFYDLLHKFEVTFMDKNKTDDTGFILELCETNTYAEMAYEVGKKINVNANRLQFYRCPSYKNTPGNPLKYSKDENLKNIFSYNRLKATNKKLFYEKLPMNITELENKIRFKVIMLSLDMKTSQEITLYLNKNDKFYDLLQEAYKIYNFEPDGTRKLRIVEIVNHRVIFGPSDYLSVEALMMKYSSLRDLQKVYRIEEIPKDQIHLNHNELLVSVSHVLRGSLSGFGIPFFIKIINGELFSDIKNRIRIKLNIQKQEFDKYKLIYVHRRKVEYLSDDYVVELSKFVMTGTDEDDIPYIAIEHEYRLQQKRTSSEKAIKIYN